MLLASYGGQSKTITAVAVAVLIADAGAPHKYE